MHQHKTRGPCFPNFHVTCTAYNKWFDLFFVFVSPPFETRLFKKRATHPGGRVRDKHDAVGWSRGSKCE